MIKAFQHVGMGVFNSRSTNEFYRRFLQFKVKGSDNCTSVKELAPVIGEEVDMHIIMTANARGGGVVEFCQHTSTEPRKPSVFAFGDLGFYEIGLKVFNFERSLQKLEEKGMAFCCRPFESILSSGQKVKSIYTRDPNGILIQLVGFSEEGRPRIGGVCHIGLGVRSMETMVAFYKNAFGYSGIKHLGPGPQSPELDWLTGGKPYQMALLNREQEASGSFPGLDPGTLKLICTPHRVGVPIYGGRRWGDIGIMEMAFDVDGLEDTMNRLVQNGAESVLEPTYADMGSGTAGSVGYVRDPEGNYLELVETIKAFWLRPRQLNSLVGPVLRLGASLGIV